MREPRARPRDPRHQDAGPRRALRRPAHRRRAARRGADPHRVLAARPRRAGPRRRARSSYLVKPFQKSDLIPAIEVALGRHAELDAASSRGRRPRRAARGAEDHRPRQGHPDGRHGMNEAEAWRFLQTEAMNRRTQGPRGGERSSSSVTSHPTLPDPEAPPHPVTAAPARAPSATSPRSTACGRSRSSRSSRTTTHYDVGEGRVPRRRHVLRALRLPDHDAARRSSRRGSTRSGSLAFWGRRRPPAAPGAAARARVRGASTRDARRRRRTSSTGSAATRSRASSTSRTGGSSSTGQSYFDAVQRARRRCATCGRSRSRSSSTWCGRSWSSGVPAPRPRRLARARRVCVVGIVVSVVPDGGAVPRRTTRRGRTTAPTHAPTRS